MNALVFSQVLGSPRTWGFGDIMVAIIIVAAVICITWLALRHFGVEIPQIAVQIFWIVVVAFLAVLAIKFLLAM